MLALIAIACAVVAGPEPAQWVYLVDKGPGALNVDLTARALERRALRRTAPGLTDERDAPVLESYVEQIEAAGAEVRVASRWLNAVSVEASDAELAAIVSMGFVTRIEPVRTGRRAPMRSHVGGSVTAGGEYGLAETQLSMLDLIALHQLGLTGEGVVIGVLDTGFELTHEAYNEPGHEIKIITTWDFINDDPDVGFEPGDPDGQFDHGTIVLGAMGAYKPFDLIGGAPDASFILCKTEDVSSETQVEEDYYVAGLEFAEAHGADVVTSSLGYIDWYTQDDLDGMTAVTTVAVNIATENGVHCCTAAGNEGHDAFPGTSHLIAPADALKVITVGAVEPTGEDASFTSDGPTADGRVKPEVLAMGDQVWSVSPYSDDAYGEYAGTSLATPLMASLVACLTQAHPEWSVDRVRTMLMASGDWYGQFGEPDSLFIYGYGVPNATTANGGDCNANGIEDAEEIALGMAGDCDGNGVPDECDITFGTYEDADLDGVPDACAGCPADVNGDGMLNVLDFVAFQSAFTKGLDAADCDGNGSLDVLDFICYQGLFQAGCG